VDATTALGLVAVASGAGGVGLAVFAVKRARREASDELEGALKRCRHEHEACEAQLHRWRVTHPGEVDPE
jgi:hypothetical protein